MKNISYPHNSYLVIEYPFKMAVTLETSPHPLLSMQLPLTLKRRIILPDNLTNTVEWRYTSPGDGNEMLWGRREDQAGRGGMGLPTPSKVYASPSRGDLRTRLGDGRQSSEGINSNSQGYEGKTLLVRLNFSTDSSEVGSWICILLSCIVHRLLRLPNRADLNFCSF